MPAEIGGRKQTQAKEAGKSDETSNDSEEIGGRASNVSRDFELSDSECSDSIYCNEEIQRHTKDLVEAKRRAAAAAAALSWQPNVAAAGKISASPLGKRIQGVPFSRMNDGTNRGFDGEWETQVGKLSEADNSYEARFGEGGYGAKASAVLRKVRGKDFRHEKTKRKRGTYRGGIIDTTGGKSFKFAHSDDEG